MLTLAQAAIAYARHGRRVFPLRPGAKQPATAHGVKDATTDAEQIAAWWRQNPRHNIGLAVLPHEVVVDVDVRNGGDQTLMQWEESNAAIPITPTQITPTTGTHFFFARPAGVELVGNPGPGIDVLGVGKYVVTAPSAIDGRPEPYRWGTRLSRTPLARLPDWLARLVLRKPAPPPKPPPALGTAGADVLSRAEKYLAKCEPAISGQAGHATAFRVVVKLVRGFALDDATALDLLERIYNPRCQPPWSRRDLKHKIRQAIAKGDYEWGALRDRPMRRAS